MSNFWTAFHEENGKASFSRIVAAVWFLIVAFIFVYDFFSERAIPESYDNLTYTFFGSYVLAKGGQAWLEGRKKP